MTADAAVLRESWQAAARQVQRDACRRARTAASSRSATRCSIPRTFISSASCGRWTRRSEIVTVPGITASSAAAALTNFPVGQGKQLVTIVPAADDLDQFAAALDRGGTVVLMKIGRRLAEGARRVGARAACWTAPCWSLMPACRNSGSRPTCGRLRGLPDETGYLSSMVQA